VTGPDEQDAMADQQQRESPGSTGERSDPLGLVTGGEGLITGTVVCAAVIAASAGHLESTASLTLAIVGTVTVYWLAHLHALTLGFAVSGGHHPGIAFRHALAHTWYIVAASLLPVVILLLAEFAGASLKAAAWAALYATIGLLGVYSFLAGRRGGLGLWGSLASAAAGAALGGLIALLKATLH
jgi:hypothetical protein